MIDIKVIRAAAEKDKHHAISLLPKTVLALCDEIEKLQKENEELLEIFKVKHHAALRFFEKEAALEAEIERLRKEVHNMNWALGTEGYTQMATPEEHAEHEAGMADVRAILDRMQAAKNAHEAIQKDTDRYRWLRSNPMSFGHGSLQVFMDDRCGSGSTHKQVWDSALDAAIDKHLEKKT